MCRIKGIFRSAITLTNQYIITSASLSLHSDEKRTSNVKLFLLHRPWPRMDRRRAAVAETRAAGDCIVICFIHCGPYTHCHINPSEPFLMRFKKLLRPLHTIEWHRYRAIDLNYRDQPLCYRVQQRTLHIEPSTDSNS